MKKLKYLLFIIPFLFFPNVKAQTIDVTQYSYNNLGTYGGMYYGYADDSQSASNYSFGTTYQFKLNQAYFDVRYTLPAASSITFSLNASDNDLRDTIAIYNVYDVTNQQYLNVSNFRFVSRRKVELDFTTYNSTNEVIILLSSSSYYNYITGVENWTFSSITYDIPDITVSDDTQNIINNNNQNTTDIINNQNSNTQEIIDNQNQNTQKQIESQQSCNYFDKKNIFLDGQGLDGIGNFYPSNSQGVTDYINILNSTIKLLNTNSGANNLCFYDFNKIKISCLSTSNLNNTFITIPNNANYVRFTISKTLNVPQYYICTNGSKALENTLTDDTVDSEMGESFFDDFQNDDHGLSSIITIPLNTIQSLTSSSCVRLSIPIPFTNSNVYLPCMTEIYQSYIPNVYNIWKAVTFGIIAYFICLDIFKMVKGFKDPESDKVEVLDL